MKILTYSEIATFLGCRRKCRFRYFDEIVHESRQNHTMWFGQIIHSALEAYAKEKNPADAYDVIDREFGALPAELLKPQEHEMALAMMRGYAKKYQHENIKFLALEKEFLVPILNPQTGYKSRTFRFAGKIDALVEMPDGKYLLEHKTSGDAGRVYLERVWSDLQTQLYLIAARDGLGLRLRGIIYDVLHKTRAKKNLEERYEQPEMFQRETVLFDLMTYSEFRHFLWSVAKEIHWCERKDQWLPNPMNCFSLYGNRCQYYPICSSNNNPNVIANSYVHKRAHEELTIVHSTEGENPAEAGA